VGERAHRRTGERAIGRIGMKGDELLGIWSARNEWDLWDQWDLWRSVT
jgi:hypothetical protein